MHACTPLISARLSLYSLSHTCRDLSDNEIEEIKAGDFAAPPTNRDGSERILEIRSM